jgi:hypothetical protein
VPRLGCETTIVDPNDSLKIRAGKTLKWRWETHASIALDDPTLQHHRFCMYDTDESGVHLVAALDVPAGSAWTPSSTGFRHEDRARGIRRMEVRRNHSNGARLRVEGTGPAWIPVLPLTQASAVVVQLETERGCWLAVYRAPAKLNDWRRFYDAND